MKKFTTFASLGALSIVLAACGNAEDASTDASPETVEMAADEALEMVTDEPVADDAADLDTVEGPDAVSEETASTAADGAAAIAAEAEAAAAEAEAGLNDLEEIVDEGKSALDRIGEAADTAKETID